MCQSELGRKGKVPLRGEPSVFHLTTLLYLGSYEGKSSVSILSVSYWLQYSEGLFIEILKLTFPSSEKNFCGPEKGVFLSLFHTLPVSFWKQQQIPGRGYSFSIFNFQPVIHKQVTPYYGCSSSLHFLSLAFTGLLSLPLRCLMTSLLVSCLCNSLFLKLHITKLKIEAAWSAEASVSEHMTLTYYHILEASTTGSISTGLFVTTWRLL
jgi:hypothetical protein